MSIVGYKCTLCKFETCKKGWRITSIEIEDHLQTVHQIYENFGKNLVSVESKPKKLWKCPRCATKPLSYSKKLWHTDNFHSKLLPKKMLGQNDEQS